MNKWEEIINKTTADQGVKRQFMDRLKSGHLTRDENPTSHFCSYFPAFDPHSRRVFMGLHKKSGLWLFNGGHIDKGEAPNQAVTREISEEWGENIFVVIPPPSLLTITAIENPKKQICEVHFDIWYFISVDMNMFAPDENKLSSEFSIWGWKTINEAKLLAKNKETVTALHTIEQLF